MKEKVVKYPSTHKKKCEPGISYVVKLSFMFTGIDGQQHIKFSEPFLQLKNKLCIFKK